MHIFYRYLFLYYDKQWSKNNQSIIALITITNCHLSFIGSNDCEKIENRYENIDIFESRKSTALFGSTKID